VSPSGVEHVIYSFKGSPDAAGPYGGLVYFNGAFYGTTQNGGNSHGTVYKVTPSGTEHVLHKFNHSPDGASPFGNLVVLNGTLYGTTYNGGKNNYGTVYSVSPSGTEHVLHSFTNVAPDGAYPYVGLVALNGTLYGATFGGGTSTNGIVFKI
jgi:uncharacterized repeat protein (TIGR03803 family)